MKLKIIFLIFIIFFLLSTKFLIKVSHKLLFKYVNKIINKIYLSKKNLEKIKLKKNRVYKFFE